MARRRRAQKHILSPDTKYDNQVVSKFVNYIMKCGKKSIAEKIVYGSIEKLQEKATNNETGVDAFFKILENMKPKLEVKSRRVGGSNYQVPIEVREERQVCLALRWIVQAANKRSGHSMIEKLSAELIDAYNGRGEALKKKEDMHKMAEANRAFAHFVW